MVNEQMLGLEKKGFKHGFCRMHSKMFGLKVVLVGWRFYSN